MGSTLSDLESRYGKAIERTALLEDELVSKARLEEEVQRLKDELRGESHHLYIHIDANECVCVCWRRHERGDGCDARAARFKAVTATAGPRLCHRIDCYRLTCRVEQRYAEADSACEAHFGHSTQHLCPGYELVWQRTLFCCGLASVSVTAADDWHLARLVFNGPVSPE